MAKFGPSPQIKQITTSRLQGSALNVWDAVTASPTQLAFPSPHADVAPFRPPNAAIEHDPSALTMPSTGLTGERLQSRAAATTSARRPPLLRARRGMTMAFRGTATLHPCLLCKLGGFSSGQSNSVLFWVGASYHSGTYSSSRGAAINSHVQMRSERGRHRRGQGIRVREALAAPTTGAVDGCSPGSG